MSHSDDTTVRIWDMRSEKETASLQAFSSNGWAIQFDDEKIMCNGRDCTVSDRPVEGLQIWDRR